MNVDQLKKLKEGTHVEMKDCVGGVPKSVYQTLSSFANTDGGFIYLGIGEKAHGGNELIGVKDPDKVRETLLVTANGRLSSHVINEGDFDYFELPNGNTVIRIAVQETSRLNKPVYLDGLLTKAYRRIGDADMLIPPDYLAGYFYDNSSEALDSLPNRRGFGFEEVDADTLHSYRKAVVRYNGDTHIQDLSDEAFMRRNGFLVKDDRGEEVLSNAALILFGTAPIIQLAFPYYALDYRKITTGVSKWDERISTDGVSWPGNLYGFYERTLKALSADLPSAYVAENGMNIGPVLVRDAIKEALVNCLANHSMLINGSLEVIRDSHSIKFINNGKPLLPISVIVRGGASRPRNPTILAAFRRIGAAERAGTGVPKIFDACERNLFPTPWFSESGSPLEQTTLTISFVSVKHTASLDESASAVMKALSANVGGLTIQELCKATGYGRSTISKTVNELLKNGKAKSNGKMTRGRKIILSD
jgi:ATP-dependent DNA helicase RecG